MKSALTVNYSPETKRPYLFPHTSQYLFLYELHSLLYFRNYTSSLLRKSLVNHANMVGKILKFVAYRCQQNTFPRFKISIKVLYWSTIILVGAL